MLRSKASSLEAAERLSMHLTEIDEKGQLDALVERGMLNRKILSRETDIPYTALVHRSVLKAIISKWNDKLRERGFEGSKWDPYVTKVRAYLAKAFQDGELPVIWQSFRPLICRLSICERFGLPHMMYTRHAAYRALIKEYDAKINPEKYAFQSEYEYLQKPLTDIVTSDRVPVHHGRLNIAAIANELKVYPSVFKNVPSLRKIIQNAEHQLQTRRHRFAPLVPGHRRVYDFSEFVLICGDVFSSKLAHTFADVASTLTQDTSKGYYNVLRDFLNFACRYSPQFVKEVQAGLVERNTLQNTAWSWRETKVANKA